MKRKEAVEIYSVLKELSTEKIMSIETLTDFILMRRKLKNIYNDYENTRIEISEETKPKGWKEGDSMDEWNGKYVPTMEKWLDEDIEGPQTNVLTPKGFTELIFGVSMKGEIQDLLFEKLVKE